MKNEEELAKIRASDNTSRKATTTIRSSTPTTSSLTDSTAFLQRVRTACNAERCNSYGNSVLPSVRLSHAGIVPEPMKIGSCGSKNILVF